MIIDVAPPVAWRCLDARDPNLIDVAESKRQARRSIVQILGVEHQIPAVAAVCAPIGLRVGRCRRVVLRPVREPGARPPAVHAHDPVGDHRPSVPARRPSLAPRHPSLAPR